MTTKFKVGDIVTGKPGTHYNITSNKMTRGEVVDIMEDEERDIMVKVLEHEEKPTEIGQAWPVNSEYFILVQPASQSMHITCNDGKTTHGVLKIGDRVVRRVQAVCSPHDTFDFHTGAEIVIDRLRDKVVREVNRPAKTGEYIKIVDAASLLEYKNGDILKVLKTDSTGNAYYRTGSGGFAWLREYVVLENYTHTEPEPTLSRFSFDAFKRGKFAVACDTKEKANVFLAYLQGKGIRWASGDLPLGWPLDGSFINRYRIYGGNLICGSEALDNIPVIPFDRLALD